MLQIIRQISQRGFQYSGDQGSMRRPDSLFRAPASVNLFQPPMRVRSPVVMQERDIAQFSQQTRNGIQSSAFEVFNRRGKDHKFTLSEKKN
jgi:hypothetical protein